MKNLNKITCMALAILINLPSAAYAEKGGNGKGNGNNKGGYEKSHNYNQGRGDSDSVVINIHSNDRDYIRNYIASDYRRHCPPGLAKKSPACVPPGQAKKWRMGYPLPHDVIFYPVPDDLLGHLHPVPMGYQYVRVDKDILLIGEASKKVIDAVTLLSAVGN